MRTGTSRRRSLTTLPLGLAVLALVLTLGATPVAAQAKAKTRTGDYNNYLKQLSARFISWDANGDKVLDKHELAKAFRGATAKAFDAGEEKTPSAFDKDHLNLLRSLTPFYAKVATPLNQILADLLAQDFSKNPPAVTNYNNLPDYQFILLAGTTGMTKLTKGEFDGWARQYAGSLADYAEAQRKLTASQNKLKNAKKADAKQKAMLEVAQHQQEVLQAQTAINGVPQAIQQKLAVNR